MKRRYILDDKEEKAVMDYLEGKIALRELCLILGVSHQGAKNMIPRIVQDWMADGKYGFIKTPKKKQTSDT